MATAFKDSNMPTISNNIAAKLHRWVRRAATATKDKTSTRKSYEQSYSKQTAKEAEGAVEPSGVVPGHVRSRSSPVEIFHDHVPARRMSTASCQYFKRDMTGKIMDGRNLDMSVHSGSFEDLTKYLLKSNLKKKCSQSTNSLSDTSWNGDVEELRKERLMRRTSSEDTQGSCESYGSSDLDYNGNENKDKTRVRSKENTRKTANKSAEKTTRRKVTRTRNTADEGSRDVESRLDRWVDRASRYSRSKQDSFESTSSIPSCSSDGEYGSPVFYYENSKTAPRERRELIELQTALKELVTNCGTKKVRSNKNFKNDSVAVTGGKIKLERKRSRSLLETRNYWEREDENDSQNIKRNVSDGNLQHNIELEGISIAASQLKKRNHSDAGVEYGDDVDGITMKIDSVNNTNKNVSTGQPPLAARLLTSHQEDTEFDTKALNAVKARSSPPGNVTESGGKTEIVLDNTESQSSGSRKSSAEENSRKLSKSNKNYPAPLPPLSISSSSLETESELQELRQSMRNCLDFRDADLSAFAVECVRQANEKKKKSTVEKESDKCETPEDDSSKKDDVIKENSHSLEGEGKDSKWSSQSSILTNSSSSEEKALTEKLELSDEDFKLIRHTLGRDMLNGITVNISSSESLNNVTAFEEDAVVVDFPDGKSSKSLPLEKNFIEQNEPKESVITENPGLRKFPSLPLFYIPKEEPDSIKRKSLKKTIWNKITKRSPSSSLARSTENISKSVMPASTMTASPRFLDPFYHAESPPGPKCDEELQPVTRPKASSHSEATRTSANQNSRAQIRPALETRRSVPIWKKKSTKKNNENNDESYEGYSPDTGGVEELV